MHIASILNIGPARKSGSTENSSNSCPEIRKGEGLMLTVQKRLIETLMPQAKSLTIKDLRIGLGYCAVQLDSGQGGVAWTPKNDSDSCTHVKVAGTFAGSPAGEILELLAHESSSLMRAVGLSTANAVLASLPLPPVAGREEIIASLHITDSDHVAMVGYFAPIVGKLQKAGCRLDIVELKPKPGLKMLSPQQGDEALASCTVAIITGTTLINGTFDEISAALGNPRAAVLLGPSSPLSADVFHGTKITHVAGSRVKEAEAVLRIVSEGGGTMLMKPHLSFETVRTDMAS